MKNIITLLFVREATYGDYNRGESSRREEVNLRTFTDKGTAISVGSDFLGKSYDEEQADSELGSTYLTVMINGVPMSGNDYDTHYDYSENDPHTDSVLEALQTVADEVYNSILETAVNVKEQARKSREEAALKQQIADKERRKKEQEERERREYEKLKAKFES